MVPVGDRQPESDRDGLHRRNGTPPTRSRCARCDVRAARPLRHARRQRRRRFRSLQPVGRLRRAAGRRRVHDHRLLVQVPAEPVLQLHLLPRRPGQRRPVRAGRRPQRLRLDRAMVEEHDLVRQGVAQHGRLRAAPGPHRPGRPVRHARAQRLSTTREDSVTEGSAGIFVSNDTQWTPWLRSIAGLRYDRYRLRREQRRAGQHRQGRAPASPHRSCRWCSARGSGPNTSSMPATAFTATTRAASRSRSIRPRGDTGRCGDAAGAQQGRRTGSAHRDRPRPAILAGALGAEAGQRTGLRRRRRHHRGRPAVRALRRRMVEPLAAAAVDVRRLRHLLEPRPLHRHGAGRQLRSRRARPGCAGRRGGGSLRAVVGRRCSCATSAATR